MELPGCSHCSAINQNMNYPTALAPSHGENSIFCQNKSSVSFACISLKLCFLNLNQCERDRHPHLSAAEKILGPIPSWRQTDKSRVTLFNVKCYWLQLQKKKKKRSCNDRRQEQDWKCSCRSEGERLNLSLIRKPSERGKWRGMGTRTALIVLNQ